MDERHAKILYGLVDQYIQTAEPVSSAGLVKQLHLDISSASVRNVLNELDEAGFVYQPHTSAGRVPTDKGYRFYINALRHRQLSAMQRQHMERQIQDKIKDSEEPARTTAEILSSMAETVAICAWDQQHSIQQSGLAPLLQHLSEHDDQLATVQEIAILLQRLEDLLTLINDQRDVSDPTIFIGEENPLMPARYTSLMTKRFINREGNQITLIVTGPKRMPYQRNRAYLNGLAEILGDRY